MRLASCVLSQLARKDWAAPLAAILGKMAGSLGLRSYINRKGAAAREEEVTAA